MTPKRDVTKSTVRFHTRWLKFLLEATPQTLRRVCHELAALEEENQQYRDGVIFSVLRKQLEFVIQDVGRTNWSVARSRRDMRGRTRRSQRQLHIDPMIQDSLHNRLLLLNLEDEVIRQD
jgi:hypothetical protein